MDYRPQMNGMPWQNQGMAGRQMPQNAQSMMPYVTPQQIPQQPQYQYSSAQSPVSMNVDYIQGGYNSALAYPKPNPNTIVFLFDPEMNMFFAKKTDATGMPLPIEAYRYEQINIQQMFQNSNKSGNQNMDQYVTKEEFKSMLEEYFSPNNKGDNK